MIVARIPQFFLFLKVLLVDCTPLHDRMVPRLNEIYKDIIEFVADNSFALATDFVSDMQQIIKVLVTLYYNA